MAKPLSRTFADNLNWLNEHPEKAIGSQTKIAGRAKIGQRTVGRALKGEVSTTIKSIERLARAFGVEAWQLLHPELSTLVLQKRIPLEEVPKVERLRREIAELSPQAKSLLSGEKVELP